MNSATSKTLAFVFRQSPSANIAAKEGLDALLAAAAFEQSVLAIFMGEGVWQLHCDVNAQALALPDITRQLAALPLYDVDTLYVHQPSAEARGIKLTQENIVWLDDAGLSQILDNADQVLTF